MDTFKKHKLMLLDNKFITYGNATDTKIYKFRETNKLIFSNHTNQSEVSIPQQLFVVSDEKINEGDMCLVCWGVDINGDKLYDIAKCTKIGISGVHYFDEMSMSWNRDQLSANKIIAVSNNSIVVKINDVDDYQYIPKLRSSFIDYYISEYNNGNIITTVDVKYKSDVIDVDENNNIYLKPIKSTYTKNDMIAFAEKYARMVQEKGVQLNAYKAIHNMKWIEDNL